MTILLTGGLGKTTSRLASRLHAQNIPILIATRSGRTEHYPAAKFDWYDRSTWQLAFESEVAKISPIKAVWLVVLDDNSLTATVKEFVDYARSYGVERFVLLSGSNWQEDDNDIHSKVWKYLKISNVEWAVLRASWFMQNFSEIDFWHPIKAESMIVSATGGGRLPFIDVEDIAAVADKALTNKDSFNDDILVLGPEVLSYDEVAEILSNVLDRRIVHQNFSEEGLKYWFTQKGFPEEVAGMLAAQDQVIRNGKENRTNDLVASITGRPPKKFVEFAEEVKAVWE